jgi:hypothetical protein
MYLKLQLSHVMEVTVYCNQFNRVLGIGIQFESSFFLACSKNVISVAWIC